MLLTMFYISIPSLLCIKKLYQNSYNIITPVSIQYQLLMKKIILSLMEVLVKNYASVTFTDENCLK